MKPITLALVLLLGLAPALVSAQEEELDGAEGLSLMEQGARLFMRGIMQEMEPALKELEGLAEDMKPAMRDFADNMGPALRKLLEEVDDWSVYDAPEMQPNGDIIIRRKPEAAPPDRPLEDGEIEL